MASSVSAHFSEVPSQTIMSPSLNPAIQKNMDDWITNKAREFQSICKKLQSRSHTYNNFLQHQQLHTLPPDLNIKFDGYGQYPLSIETSLRDSLKQKEIMTFNAAMQSILNQRTEAYKQDINSLESQINITMNEQTILKMVSSELPYINSNDILRNHVCYQLLALYTSTRQPSSPTKKSYSSQTMETAMDESNNMKSDEHIATLIRNVLKEELKLIFKPTNPPPKHSNNTSNNNIVQFKDQIPPRNAKNESERGRDNTPRRNGTGSHVRRSKSDSSHRSKSNSSINTNRVHNSNRHFHSKNTSSPQGRNRNNTPVATVTPNQDDQRYLRNNNNNNLKSKSPPPTTRNNYNNNHKNRQQQHNPSTQQQRK